MVLDAQPSPSRTRPATTSPGLDATRGRPGAVRRPSRAAVRRRFDEAALAAAVRELRTHRHVRIGG